MYDRVNWTLYPIEWNIANLIWLRSQFYLRSLRKWAIQLVGIEHYGYEIASMYRCAWNRLERKFVTKNKINIASAIKMTNEISDWIGLFFFVKKQQINSAVMDNSILYMWQIKWKTIFKLALNLKYFRILIIKM